MPKPVLPSVLDTAGLADDTRNRVLHLRRAGRLDDATALVLAVLEQTPYSADAHDLLAHLLLDRHDHQRALDEWEMALRLQPDHVGALKGLGFLAYRRGDYASAARYLELAGALAPQDADVAAAVVRTRAAVDRPPPTRAAESVTPRGVCAIGATPRPVGTPPAEGPRRLQRLATTPLWTRAVTADPAAQGAVSLPVPLRDPVAPAARREQAAESVPVPEAEPSVRPAVVAARPAVTQATPAIPDVPAAVHDAGPRLLRGLSADVHTGIVVDADGLVLSYAGRCSASDAAISGAEMCALADEIAAASASLGLGLWVRATIESRGDAGALAIAPLAAGGAVLLATHADAPLGMTRRWLRDAQRRAERWLVADDEEDAT